MFDSPTTVIGLSGDSLSSGESHDEVGRGDDLAYRLTCLEMADGWVDEDRHLLPSEFEILPLPYLAVVAGAADRTRMNGHDLVRLLSAEQRLASSFEARKLATMAEVAFSPAGDAESPVERSPSEIEYAACEIAPALTLTRRSAEAQLSLALSLTGRLRRVWERIASGDLSLVKARELARILGHLPENVVEVVLDRILDAAPELTVGQLRARVSRLALEADPSAVEHGLVEGLADRRSSPIRTPTSPGRSRSNPPTPTMSPRRWLISKRSHAVSRPATRRGRWIRSATTSPSTSCVAPVQVQPVVVEGSW